MLYLTVLAAFVIWQAYEARVWWYLPTPSRWKRDRKGVWLLGAAGCWSDPRAFRELKAAERILEESLHIAEEMASRRP